jgi:hypothetical protein
VNASAAHIVPSVVTHGAAAASTAAAGPRSKLLPADIIPRVTPGSSSALIK